MGSRIVKKRSAHLVIWVVCLVLVIAADQASKLAVEASLSLGQSGWDIGIVKIQRSVNTGIAWGFFQGSSALFAYVIPVVVVVISGFYLGALRRETPMVLVTVGFGLLVGGATGNLIDRYRMDGVTDFINPSFFASFNVADTAISCGLVIVALSLLLSGKKGEPETQPTAGESEAELGSERDSD